MNTKYNKAFDKFVEHFKLHKAALLQSPSGSFAFITSSDIKITFGDDNNGAILVDDNHLYKDNEDTHRVYIIIRSNSDTANLSRADLSVLVDKKLPVGDGISRRKRKFAYNLVMCYKYKSRWFKFELIDREFKCKFKFTKAD